MLGSKTKYGRYFNFPVTVSTGESTVISLKAKKSQIKHFLHAFYKTSTDQNRPGTNQNPPRIDQNCVFLVDSWSVGGFLVDFGKVN